MTVSAWYQPGMHALFREKSLHVSSLRSSKEINSVYSIDFKKISCCYVIVNHRDLKSAEYCWYLLFCRCCLRSVELTKQRNMQGVGYNKR